MLTKNVVSSKVFSQEMRVNESGLAVSVVVPTRNEAGNVEKLLASLRKAFYGTFIEVIFVDDSTDDTPQVVEAAVERFPAQNVRLIHRAPGAAGWRSGWGGGRRTEGGLRRLRLRHGWRPAAPP